VAELPVTDVVAPTPEYAAPAVEDIPEEPAAAPPSYRRAYEEDPPAATSSEDPLGVDHLTRSLDEPDRAELGESFEPSIGQLSANSGGSALDILGTREEVLRNGANGSNGATQAQNRAARRAAQAAARRAQERGPQ
jgi:hypothetical protein